MSKWCIQATWDDVPHLSQREKDELWNEIPPHQRDARARGIPVLGSGVIYPVPEGSYSVEPFEIPPHWPRVFGMDVGWNRTAAIWAAIDRESDTAYLYSEHYMGQAEPSIHADAIRARGAWIPGVIDPAANGRNQKDGDQLMVIYQGLGLQVSKANNAVEAGIHEVFQRLSSGRLKVFRTLTSWFSEVRIYRRDENGKVVKQNDHLMDATRYLVLSGLGQAIKEPIFSDDYIYGSLSGPMTGRNAVTGY